MLFVLFLLVLLIVLAMGWLGRSMSRQQRDHDNALRRMEASWSEKLGAVEGSLAEKAGAEDVRNLAAMIDGVVTAGLRIERRVSHLENGASFPPSKNP